jgi:hypothetical protein
MEEILLYIWRWKIVPTWMVQRRFFEHHHYQAAYDALTYAKSRKLVSVSGCVKSRRYGWTLAEKGFKRIERKLQFLKERGFRTEAPSHDLLVAVIHGGLTRLYMDVDPPHVLSEQQLRRIDPDRLPSWCPRYLDRRPDGMWWIPKRKQVVALEVEISRKEVISYMRILDAYSLTRTLHHIVWVAGSGSIRNHILRGGESGWRTNPYHTWTVLLRDVERLGFSSVLQNVRGEACAFGDMVYCLCNVPSQLFGKVNPFDLRISLKNINQDQKEVPQAESRLCVPPTSAPPPVLIPTFNQENG